MASCVSCPICNKASAPRADNRSFPFCGSRCKTIDLGKWLLEEYRVPSDESPDVAEEPVRARAYESKAQEQRE